jgi:subfamily B ATP-binding cassette protein MsbA
MAPILDLALGSGAPAPSRAGWSNLSLRTLGGAVGGWLGLDAGHDRLWAVGVLCAAYVGVGLLKSASEFGGYLLGLSVRMRAATAIQAELFRHLLGLSLDFFKRRRVGDLTSRLDTDVRAVTYPLDSILVVLLTAPPLILFYGFLLVQTSPLLVGAALAGGVAHYGVTRVVRGPIRRLATDQFSALAALMVRFQEVIANIREVKALSAEARELGRVRGLLRDLVRLHVWYGVYKHADEPARNSANYLVEALIVFMGAWELLTGRMTAATFFLFMYVGRVVMVQVGRLGTAWVETQTVLAAAGRVFELIDERPSVPDGAETIHGFRDVLALRDVSFAYGETVVFEHVDLDIRRGQIVALVGPSGIGKTTLADLILRFYDPTAGAITIDGRDLRRLRQASYRALFGVVSQDAVLFNTTIAENIAYGRDGLTRDDIVAAARIANAHDFITEFPDGYDTMVGERGVRLSGGQRQRVAIARAIATRPQILVLDEATSSLDSESEKLVQDAIDRVIVGSTSIVIAHRLSTVLHADQIVVLNDRRVEAIGTHATLLETNETYSRLYRLQFEVAR